jgi:hypothetical protein
MTLLSTAVSLAAVGFTLLAMPGCSGKTVRLGDQSAPTSGAAGVAGSGGVAGMAGSGGSSGGAAGTGAGASAGSSGGGAGDAECNDSSVLASEVLWIGDSWSQVPGTQIERLQELSGESYPNVAIGGASMADVARQYERRQATSEVKVLLMNGGTWDPIAAQMSGGSIPDAIDGAVARFREFLVQVASDGTVEHIVYFLQPELPTIPGVAIMRPSLQDACTDSTVPCYFIDLQEWWRGHPEYTGPSGIQASEAGGRVIAEQIWATMQAHCIAQ